MNPDPETERLREVFRQAAYDLTPPPLPLAAIERAGRARRRRRVAGLASVTGLLVASATVTALGLGTSRLSLSPGGRTQTGTVSAAAAGRPGAADPLVRVVAPDERVTVSPGLTMWLTQAGMYASNPAAVTEFIPRIGGTAVRGVSARSQDISGDWFVYGVCFGHGAPAKVRLRLTDGTVLPGHVLKLAGAIGWGAFYFDYASVSAAPVPRDAAGLIVITAYDATGGVIAENTTHNLSPARTPRGRSTPSK